MTNNRLLVFSMWFGRGAQSEDFKESKDEGSAKAKRQHEVPVRRMHMPSTRTMGSREAGPGFRNFEDAHTNGKPSFL
jgi:hypothetical protein